MIAGTSACAMLAVALIDAAHATWTQLPPLFPDTYPMGSGMTSLALTMSADETPIVAFSLFNKGLMVKSYNGSGWVQLGESLSESNDVTVIADANEVALSYIPWTSGPPTFSDLGANGSWKNALVEEKSSANVQFVSLASAPDGKKFAATQDKVFSWNGTYWNPVGKCTTEKIYDPTTGKTISLVDCPYTPYCEHKRSTPCHSAAKGSLAIHPASGEPYLFMQDCLFQPGSPTCISQKALMMTFNGSSWVSVGPLGFSMGDIADPFMAFSPSGGLFVAFADQSAGGKLTVMKYGANSMWTTLGGPGFSHGPAKNPCLAFHPHDETPYVAFYDGNVTVHSFNSVDNSWEIVADAMWPGDQYEKMPIEFDSRGSLYVSYVLDTVLYHGPIVKVLRSTSTPSVIL